jgi:hypothetical protein
MLYDTPGVLRTTLFFSNVQSYMTYLASCGPTGGVFCGVSRAQLRFGEDKGCLVGEAACNFGEAACDASEGLRKLRGNYVEITWRLSFLYMLCVRKLCVRIMCTEITCNLILLQPL